MFDCNTDVIIFAKLSTDRFRSIHLEMKIHSYALLHIVVAIGMGNSGQQTGSTVSLNHWGRVTHICVSDLTIIGSDNGLLPGRRQAIIWTNAGILLNGPLGTNFSEILIGIKIFSFKKKMRLKMLSAKWCPFCLGINVLKLHIKFEYNRLYE